jgi:hypothetical protein
MQAIGTNRRVVALLSVAIVWASHQAPVPARAQDQGAIVLRRPMLLPPRAAAGTGLEPEVKVRITVDRSGRVSAVQVESVTPSSSYDSVFADHTSTEVSQWRFAPARKDGEPLESVLSLAVQYRDTARPDTGSPAWDPLHLAREDPRRYGEELLRLSPADRQKWIERYSQAAERRLTAKRRQRFDSPRFVVVTDAEDPKTAEILAGNLEAVFNVLHGLFDPGIEPQPERYKIVAYLLADRTAYGAIELELRGTKDSAGFYAPPGFLAFHQEALPDRLLGTMLHEATHAFVDRHLKRPGVLLPLWFEEGIAEYLGNSQITRKGELVPGKTVQRKLILAHAYGPVRLTTDAGLSLDALRAALRKGEVPTLPALVAATAPVFYGAEAELHYGLSWLFVHFLRHGSAGWETRFPELVLYLVEGYPSPDALAASYGSSASELAAAFTEYVADF